MGASNCFAHRFLLAFVERLVYMCECGWRASHVAGDSNTESRRATSPLRRRSNNKPIGRSNGFPSTRIFQAWQTRTQPIGRSWRHLIWIKLGWQTICSSWPRVECVAASRRIVFIGSSCSSEPPASQARTSNAQRRRPSLFFWHGRPMNGAR